MKLNFAALIGVALVLSGCITPKEKKEMQGDIFNVQTRLLSLERGLTDTSKEAKTSGDSAAKRVASTQADLERMSRDIQQIRGDIDSLRIGVTTGRMPGASDQDASIATQLTEITERLQALEESQEELLEALKKAGLKGNSKSASKKLASVEDMQTAFDAKRYRQIVDEGNRVVKAADGAEKEQATFLVAESLFKLGKMREAALKYSDFLEAKPDDKFLPVVKMRLGDCFRNLGDGDTARVYYEELVKEFPDSDEAAKAKERLADSGNGAEKG